MTTLAPCSCAASAAQNAALPPPTTTTSYSAIVAPPHRSILHHAPLDRFAAAIDQGTLVGSFDLDLFGRGPARFLQRDPVLVWRQFVMPWPVQRSKRFELIERALLLEHLGVGFDR